jgi:glycyl-tRNA synthetase (class II)
VDSQTLEDDTVTVRERDNLKQIRLPQQEVTQFLNQECYNHLSKILKAKK